MSNEVGTDGGDAGAEEDQARADAGDVTRTDGGDANRVLVCDVADVPDGERVIVDVKGVEVGVINVDGELFAVRNACPHRYGPVCEGKVTNALVGTWPGVGQRLEESMTGDPAIACPWHGWEFDLATGVHLGDADYSVATYDVVVEGDGVYLEL